MEILKQGDADRVLGRKEFTCEKCGCIFVAQKMEYRCCDQMEWLDRHVSYKCECPTCGSVVYR